jgi:hypothetical protein
VNRRSALPTVRILFTIVLALGVTALAPTAAGAAPDEPAPPPTTVPITVPDDVTIDTANPFLPDEVDLSQCVGTLPRPGCGSEARGGWHQDLVAIAMIAGLLIVFGRVAWGVRRNRRANDVDERTDEPDSRPPDDGASHTGAPDIRTPDARTPDDGADLTSSP